MKISKVIKVVFILYYTICEKNTYLYSFSVHLQMTDVSTILGVGLLGFGAASAIYGSVLCYTTKVSTYAVFSD